MRFIISQWTSQVIKNLDLFTRQAYLPLTSNRLTPFLIHERKVYSSFTRTFVSPNKRTLKRKLLAPPSSCLVAQYVFESTGMPQFYVPEVKRNEVIMSLRTVEEYLEFYKSCKDEASLVNRITILHHIAKLVHRFRREREVLAKEIERSLQGQGGSFDDLLNCISDNIISCTPQGLANIMWALGRIRLTNHALVRVCEMEILMHDVAVFHTAEVCQILHGCSALDLKESNLFKWVEDGVLKKRIILQNCENRHIAAILSCFVKTNFGSQEFFHCLEDELVSRKFTSFTNGHLVQFVSAFAKMGICSDEVFDKVEEELLRRSVTNLKKTEVLSFLWAFALVGKGSDNLFAGLENNIVNRGMKSFQTSSLVWMAWSLAQRKIKSIDMFKLLELEICERGLSELSNRDLTFFLHSYVLGEIPCPDFLLQIKEELLSRNFKLFDSLQLAQISWSFGTAGISSPELFSSLETVIMKHEFSETQARMIMEGFINSKHHSQQVQSYLRSFI